MEKVLVSDRTDFPVAEEAGQSGGTQIFLHMTRIMIWFSEKTMSPPIATAEAGAVDGAVVDLFAQFLQKGCHVFSSSSGVAALELNSLARARIGTDSEGA